MPSVLIASSEFRDAAAAQGRSLGAEPATAFVPHPIQDRTAGELRALADAAVDEVIAQITG